MYRRSAELLKALSTDLDPRLPVARLSTAQQQLVEIAKAMSFKSRVVIMDEPTASLTKREIDVLFELIRRMRAEGMGIVYISHRFEEILAIGDRFTVLRDGRRVGTLPIQAFKPDSVIWMMAGRSIDEMYPRAHAVHPEPVLEVRGLRLAPHTPPIDLTVRRGEVVGLGGLVGSGRTELAKSVFGARRFHGGEVRYLGRKTNGWSPARLIRAGMAYLSEDRKTEGLIPPMSIRENLSLASLRSVATLGFLSRPREERQAAGPHPAAEHRRALQRAAGVHPQRRQPAEVRPGQVAEHRAAAAHAGRAHPGHRRGRQGPNPQADRPDRRQLAWASS